MLDTSALSILLALVPGCSVLPQIPNSCNENLTRQRLVQLVERAAGLRLQHLQQRKLSVDVGKHLRHELRSEVRNLLLLLTALLAQQGSNPTAFGGDGYFLSYPTNLVRDLLSRCGGWIHG